MIKYITSALWMLICIVGITAHTYAQSFEGIVEINQKTADGITYQMKWYIKGEKIAYEINSYGAESLMPLRFVPLPEHDKLLMIAGTNRSELATKDLSTPAGFDTNGLTAREEGGKVIVTTETTITEVEVDKTVGVSFARFAKFFKADYSISGLAKLQMRGFPVNSTTRDAKTGKILSQNTLKRVQATKLDDSLFR